MMPPHVSDFRRGHPSDDDIYDEARSLYCDRCGYLRADSILGRADVQTCTCERCELCGALLLETDQCPEHPTCIDCGGYVTSDAPPWWRCDCGKEHGTAHEPERTGR